MRIIGAREPGSDRVVIRNSVDDIVVQLSATGPTTEEVVPDIGRNGEDGVLYRRVYKDRSGKRWSYKNMDAHPSFQLMDNPELYVTCSP